MRLFFLIGLFGFSFVLYANNESKQNEIKLRIQPIGLVSVLKNQPESGGGAKKELSQKTYEHYCVVCHRDGLAGAPRFRSEHDWKPRLISRTLDELVASSIKGLKAMPAKGTCIKCSEEDLKAAISYMLPRS